MVALLQLSNGEPFATGLADCQLEPLSQGDKSTRVVVWVKISGISTRAIFDTASPYPICAPAIAEQIDSSTLERLQDFTLVTRNGRIRGVLYRMPISFPAREGDSLEVDATVFIPSSADDWHGLPSYIGLTGCIERMRFAFDPGTSVIYFGPL